MMIVLETQDLRKYYGEGDTLVRALDGVDLTVEEGQFVSIVGTSGSGKSTLLHMLGGLDRATSGKVLVGGRDIFALGADDLTIFRRRQIGFVFQAYNLVPVLNVYENIVLPIELDGEHIDRPFVDSVIETLGLESKLNNLPYVSESIIVLQQEKLVALIYPDFDDAFAHGLQQEDIQKVMEQNRIELNLQLPNYSQISKIKIHFEEFEKTAKKSIKRFMYQEAKG